MIQIDTLEQYQSHKGAGKEPLLGGVFRMDVRLRIEIQRELFGRGHTPAENEKFYRWCWNHKNHFCEECMKPLGYSATYISHILTRGAHPEMAHDPRNVNILCFKHHAQWENGYKGGMRIYQKNQRIITELKQDYRDE